MKPCSTCECKPLFSLEIVLFLFILCAKKKGCPVYAKQCFKGFFLKTKGKTCGNLRPYIIIQLEIHKRKIESAAAVTSFMQSI